MRLLMACRAPGRRPRGGRQGGREGNGVWWWCVVAALCCRLWPAPKTAVLWVGGGGRQERGDAGHRAGGGAGRAGKGGRASHLETVLWGVQIHGMPTGVAPSGVAVPFPNAPSAPSAPSATLLPLLPRPLPLLPPPPLVVSPPRPAGVAGGAPGARVVTMPAVRVYSGWRPRPTGHQSSRVARSRGGSCSSHERGGGAAEARREAWAGVVGGCVVWCGPPVHAMRYARLRLARDTRTPISHPCAHMHAHAPPPCTLRHPPPLPINTHAQNTPHTHTRRTPTHLHGHEVLARRQRLRPPQRLLCSNAQVRQLHTQGVATCNPAAPAPAPAPAAGAGAAFAGGARAAALAAAAAAANAVAVASWGLWPAAVATTAAGGPGPGPPLEPRGLSRWRLGAAPAYAGGSGRCRRRRRWRPHLCLHG